MQFALIENVRVPAAPKLQALCPSCNNAVKAKCGKIKIWHWAHLSLKDCDPWYEPEGEWHRKWKNEFPVGSQEVVMKPHRADVYHKGTVIEFQSSSISFDDVMEREKFYGKMIWFVNKSKNDTQFSWAYKKTKYGKPYVAFRWKWCSEIWKLSNKPIYVDIGGDYILKIWKIFENGRGAGEMLDREKFLKLFL